MPSFKPQFDHGAVGKLYARVFRGAAAVFLGVQSGGCHLRVSTGETHLPQGTFSRITWSEECN